MLKNLMLAVVGFSFFGCGQQDLTGQESYIVDHDTLIGFEREIHLDKSPAKSCHDSATYSLHHRDSLENVKTTLVEVQNTFEFFRGGQTTCSSSDQDDERKEALNALHITLAAIRLDKTRTRTITRGTGSAAIEIRLCYKSNILLPANNDSESLVPFEDLVMNEEEVDCPSAQTE